MRYTSTYGIVFKCCRATKLSRICDAAPAPTSPFDSKVLELACRQHRPAHSPRMVRPRPLIASAPLSTAGNLLCSPQECPGIRLALLGTPRISLSVPKK